MVLWLIWLWERLYSIDGLSESPVLIAVWVACELRPGPEVVIWGFRMSLISCLRGSGLFIDVCDLSYIVRAGRLDAEIHTEVFQMMCNVC